MSQVVERTAVVRVDAKPSGKKFQGVWLEFGPDHNWVIAYRPHEVWRAFEDRAVIVTGHCYRPFGQAINSTHFHVDTMRPVEVRQARRFLAVHPERLVKGMVVAADAPAGSKLAESGLQQFRDDSGATWWIAGSDAGLTVGRAVTAAVRVVDLSPSWAASPGGEHVWIASTYGPDYTRDPQTEARPCACPDE